MTIQFASIQRCLAQCLVGTWEVLNIYDPSLNTTLCCRNARLSLWVQQAGSHPQLPGNCPLPVNPRESPLPLGNTSLQTGAPNMHYVGGDLEVGVSRHRPNVGLIPMPLTGHFPHRAGDIPSSAWVTGPLAPRPQITGWGGRGLSSQADDVLMTFPSPPPRLRNDNNNPPRGLHTSYSQLIHVRS